MPELHKCAKEDCNAQCSKEYCRHHVNKKNNCKHPGCHYKCRKEYCFKHNPATMEYSRQYAMKYREAKKLLAIEV